MNLGVNLISWREEMLIDVPSVDAQHKSLISTINDLANSCSEEPEVVKSVQEKSLLKLKTYTLDHFLDEERLMGIWRYPEIESHKRKHEIIVLHLSHLDAQKNSMTFMLDLMSFLSNWLEQHILHEDMDYKPYAKAYARAHRQNQEKIATQSQEKCGLQKWDSPIGCN